jgi:hypothetical protein
MCEQTETETPPFDLETINNILCLITIASETLRDYSDEKKDDLISILDVVKSSLT